MERDPRAMLSPARVEWIKRLLPITTAFADAVAATDLSGRRLALHQHVVADTAIVVPPFVEAGADVRVAACDLNSTDDAVASYLTDRGIEVHAWSGMTPADHAAGLRWLVEKPADVLSDMGGELILAAAQAGWNPVGALEATTTGLTRLRGVPIPFPVLDWNSVELKDRIHNRHHVGLEAWPAFTAVTGMTLVGKQVLVIGFGPVGRGVAIRARELGADVTVVDVSAVRLVEARHHGCRTGELAAELPRATIVVTATGTEGVLGEAQLRLVPEGAVLVNVGHSRREIDMDWLDSRPRDSVLPHLDRYRIGDRSLYVVNRGSLVNLTPGLGVAATELFDPFGALMVVGLEHLLRGRFDGGPGLHPYPAELVNRVAAAMFEEGRGMLGTA